MNWFAVYNITTGALVSVGTVVASPLPQGLAAVDLGAFAPTGVWNSLTHIFDPAATLKPILSLKDFAGRFTSVEREALFNMQQNGTATQKNKLGAFRQYLTDCNSSDLNDAYIQASVQLMETAGVLAVGRAAVVLA